jgi:phage tail sheath protein FI
MMALHPGVYVEEVPSAAKPIAGVGTSTAGFIGVFGDNINIMEDVGTGDGTKREFPLKHYPVVTDVGSFKVNVAGTDTNAELVNDDANKISKATVTGAAPKASEKVTVEYKIKIPTAAGEMKLCTNFTEFTKAFGDFSTLEGQRKLAHAVYGFFNNGGTRCYVARQIDADAIDAVLSKFATINEIAIVAAPGVEDVHDKLVRHCQIATGDRFAILDSDENLKSGDDISLDNIAHPGPNTYAAFYFPWLQVFDPATGRNIFVPPSGHVAGIYARVDYNRGVHKAPANEVVLGATGLKWPVSKVQWDGLNWNGINCILSLHDNITVWGARTIGGDANLDFKYVNVRRLVLYLLKSIDEGIQWVVFEPNNPALWQKITRNVTAFLTNVWRDGALFGNTPQEAFYVKCDAETNPPELRDLGQVVTEIGVAVIRPAEFVVFRISQLAEAGK